MMGALWGTPVAQDDNKSPEAHIAMKRRMKGGPRNTVTSLQVQAQMWTTPQAHDVTARGAGQVPTSKAGNACLARDAMNWPTATSSDANGARNATAGRRNPESAHHAGVTLNDAVWNWPNWGTPRGSDGEKGGPNMSFGAGGTPLPAQAPNCLTRKDGKSRLDMLDFAAEQGFTLPDPLTWTPGGMSLPSIQMARRLYRSATSRLSPATLRRLSKLDTFQKRRLNAVFTEWLMGWPEGHALCGCSVTEFSRWQQHMRGALSALPTASAAWIWQEPQEKPEAKQMELF